MSDQTPPSCSHPERVRTVEACPFQQEIHDREDCRQDCRDDI
jgi:hypothetical protein